MYTSPDIYTINYIWTVNNKEYIYKAGFFFANSPHDEEIKITKRILFNYMRYCPTKLKNSEEIKDMNFTATLKIKYEKTDTKIEELLKFMRRIRIDW